MVWSSMMAPKFNKHLKKAGGHISQNVVNIIIKMKTIVWKPWTIKRILVSKYRCQSLIIQWCLIFIYKPAFDILLCWRVKVPIKKVMQTVWGMKETLIIDFLKEVTTINSAFCCQLLRSNSPYLLKDPHIMVPKNWW